MKPAWLSIRKLSFASPPEKQICSGQCATLVTSIMAGDFLSFGSGRRRETMQLNWRSLPQRGRSTGGPIQHHLSRYDNLPVSRMNVKSESTAAAHLEPLWDLKCRSEGCSAISEESENQSPALKISVTEVSKPSASPPHWDRNDKRMLSLHPDQDSGICLTRKWRRSCSDIQEVSDWSCLCRLVIAPSCQTAWGSLFFFHFLNWKMYFNICEPFVASNQH